MQNLLVLVSGGRSSSMMARHIQTSDKYKEFNKLYVFTNTGQERPETIQFLKDMVYYWKIPLNVVEGVYSTKKGVGVKSKLVDLDTLSMDGSPYTNMIAHVNKNKNIGVPCSPVPYCSNYLKTLPAHHFAKSYFNSTKYIKALGYRSEDMPKRISIPELNADNKRIAPLLTDFDRPVNQSDLTYFFNSQPFSLSITSDLGNCELCWKKSEANLIKCIQSGTRFINWHREMELKYGNRFFRNRLSIDDLVKQAENNPNVQYDMFEQYDNCVCSF